MLLILERAIAALDKQEAEDSDDINIDTVDWGRSSHHRNSDEDCDDININTIDWGRSSHHRAHRHSEQ